MTNTISVDSYRVWRFIEATPYSYLARGDWVLTWRERAQFSN